MVRPGLDFRAALRTGKIGGGQYGGGGGHQSYKLGDIGKMHDDLL